MEPPAYYYYLYVSKERLGYVARFSRETLNVVSVKMPTWWLTRKFLKASRTVIALSTCVYIKV